MKNIGVVLAAALVLASCGKQEQKPSANNSANQSTNSTDYKGNVSLASGVTPSGGESAADFSWYDDAGKRVSLNDLKGKTVLINFWATWCGPCKMELPDIESLSKEYASKGLVIIGVSVDKGADPLGNVSGFAASNGLTYQIVIDTKDIADAYGNINAIPTSFILDKSGHIVQKWVGVRDKAFFEAAVTKYLD